MLQHRTLCVCEMREALQLARSAVSREDLICITGSFYLIGQAKMRFQPTVALAAS